MAAIMAAGIVPPLSISVAKLIGRCKFDNTQHEAGKVAFVLACALFHLRRHDPLHRSRADARYPALSMVAGALAGALSIMFVAMQWRAWRAVRAADPGCHLAGDWLYHRDCRPQSVIGRAVQSTETS